MVLTCDIQFDNNSEATFYAGQLIEGKVTLTADKIKQVKAVTLKINGCAKTRWTENGSQNSSNTTYYGKVEYMNTSTNFLAPKAADQAVTIKPGIQTFSFACYIPANCPSSFESANGSIRYITKVSLVRPWKFDQTFTKAFTVLAVKNLNYDSPVLKLPVISGVSKVFCCGPFKSDPLQINVKLSQTGYVPGQLIPVNILVTNETNARIDEMSVRLVMIATVFSMRPVRKSKTETKTVSKFIGDSVVRQCKKQFNYLLPIPATPSTCFTLCSIIQITYRVEVKAKIQGIMYKNQFVHTPVTIGNVPLQMEGMIVEQQPMPREFNSNHDVQISSEVIEYNNDPCNRNVEPWSAMANIPAPVYMEPTHMLHGKLSEDTDHDYGDEHFIPKYPVFNIANLQESSRTDETDGAVASRVVADP